MSRPTDAAVPVRGSETGTGRERNPAAGPGNAATLTASRPRRPLHPLTRRRAASRRLAILPSGVADPLTREHDEWRDQHDLLMAKLGLAEPWQLERARRLWSGGAR